jgi:DNA-binding NarL/FixJ family response regulator
VTETLTNRERQIVEAVARGRTNLEVASELGLSHKTVEWILTRVYRKLGVRSRIELVLRIVDRQSDPRQKDMRGSCGGRREETS